jgi:hypothetical protein
MSTTTSASADLDLSPIIDRYFAAWAARDPERIVALHADETRFVTHTGAEPAVGKAAVRKAFAAIFELFPDFHFEEHRTIYGPRHWLLDWTLLSGDLRLHCFDLVEVDDAGLVVNKETYVDVAQYNALGAPTTTA